MEAYLEQVSDQVLSSEAGLLRLYAVKARADAADARNAVLSADNDELRAETRSCQEKLLQALSLLEEYQEEMTDMSSRKRTGLPSRVDALSKPRTPPVSPSRR